MTGDFDEMLSQHVCEIEYRLLYPFLDTIISLQNDKLTFWPCTDYFEWNPFCLLTYCIAIFWFACLCYIDVIWWEQLEQGPAMLKCRCHHATPKTACLMLASQRYHLYKPSYGTFCVHVLQNSLPWQQRLAVVKFKCHHSFARPRKPRLMERSRWYLL